MSKFRAFPLLIVLALVLAVLTYAFAAQNTVTASIAGDGTGVISGNTVTVHYVLKADPQQINTVDLTLGNALPGTSPTVTARLQTGTAPVTWSSWYPCTGSGTAWSCDVSGGNITVLSVTNIQVVTAQ